MILAMKITALLLAAFMAAPLDAAEAPKSEPAKVEAPKKASTEDTLYALGLWLAQKVSVFNLTSTELKTVEAGLRDGVLGKKPKVDLNEVGPKINELAESRLKAS